MASERTIPIKHKQVVVSPDIVSAESKKFVEQVYDGSLFGNLGATLYTNKSDLRLPAEDSRIVAEQLGETDPISAESPVTYISDLIQPIRYAAYVDYSIQVGKQSAKTEANIRSQLARAAASALDKLMIEQIILKGILVATPAGNQSDYRMLREMVLSVQQNNHYNSSKEYWISSAEVLDNLRSLNVAGSDQFFINPTGKEGGEYMMNRPVMVDNHCNLDGTNHTIIYLTETEDIYLCLWDVNILIDPFILASDGQKRMTLNAYLGAGIANGHNAAHSDALQPSPP